MGSIKCKNTLLDSLSVNARKHCLQYCERVDLAIGQTLCLPNQDYDALYFPETACIALVDAVEAHPAMKVALIGNEGVLGASLALSIAQVPHQAMVQRSGKALRMPAAALAGVLAEAPELLSLLQRYLFVMMTQLSRTIACTRFHPVEARLARWLLMAHDRAQGDGFYLTHQYLADRLGVRRSAVTIAAGVLQRRELIHYSRGQITVMDRPGLERVACDCYAAVNQDCRVSPTPAFMRDIGAQHCVSMQAHQHNV